MTAKAGGNRGPGAYLDQVRGPEMSLERHRLEDAGDDLARILMKLISDVERFDAMVTLQRKLLERRVAEAGGPDDDQLNRQSERLSQEAAEVVVCARRALQQLDRLSEANQVGPTHEAHRDRGRGFAKGRHSG